MRNIARFFAKLIAKRSAHKKGNEHSQPAGGEVGFVKTFSAVLNSSDRKREAVRENTPKAKSTVDVNAEGRIKQTVSGVNYQNEDNTLAVCVNLVSFLNDNGGSWQQPVLLDASQPGGADCLLTDLKNPKIKMQIQVTRVPHKRYELSRDQSTESEETAEIFALEVIKTIEKKAKGIDNVGISLLIDVADTPFALTNAVLNGVRQHYSERIKAAGFDGIWIVGNTSSLVHEI